MCSAMHSGKEAQEMAGHTHDRVREASETETLPTDPARGHLETTTHSPNHAKEARKTEIHSHVQEREVSVIGNLDQGKEDSETETLGHLEKEVFVIEREDPDHGKVASGIENLSLDHEMVDEMVVHTRVRDPHDPMEGAIAIPADHPA
jgi:hypothetical protein